VTGVYTVLLVDDDRDILNNLCSGIDWPVYGIENVLCACDGEAALGVIRQRHVDILITDISMPNLDGLQLVRQARAHQPDIRCILLSSYSDFVYAKEAISLGVENYLIKPINTEELDNSIRKSLDNIAMRKSNIHTLLSDNVLYRWVTDDISADDFVLHARHIGVNPYFRNYCVVLLRSLQKKPLNHILAPFLLEFAKKCDIYRFVNYDGHQVLIFGAHSITQQAVGDALERCLSGSAQARDLSAAVGTVAEGAECISSSYQSAMECLMMFPNGSGHRVTLAHSHPVTEVSSYQLSLITEHLRSDTFDDSALPSWYEELFAPLKSCGLEQLNAFIDTLVVRLALHLSTGGLIEGSAKERILGLTYHFDGEPLEEELQKWFLNLLSICRVFVKTHGGSFSPITFSAISYISDHYADYVSIKDFCAKFNMNASYLGLLFKKETGIYFNDYINQTRISHAIRLLKTSGLKIAEICAKVGFGNTSYFILCFKKQTGVSPAKFRQLYCNKHSL